MAKYLEVQVSRTETTQIYLRVPIDFDEKTLYHMSSREVECLVEEQRDSYDFDIEMFSIENAQQVDREEAFSYGVWDIKKNKLLEDCEEDFEETKEEDERDELILAKRKEPVLPFGTEEISLEEVDFDEKT